MNLSPRQLDAVFEAAAECADGSGIEVRISGSCMSPLFLDGETVMVRGTRFLLPGDVAVFRNDTSLVAHRVLGWAPSRNGLGVVTRGDHCPQHDGVVPLKRLLGRATAPVGVMDRLRASADFVRIVLARLIR